MRTDVADRTVRSIRPTQDAVTAALAWLSKTPNRRWTLGLEHLPEHPLGGWRYNPCDPGDTSVVGWQIMAVRIAQAKGFVDAMYQTEKSHIPFPDDPPLIYPDAEIWRELTARRKEIYGFGPTVYPVADLVLPIRRDPLPITGIRWRFTGPATQGHSMLYMSHSEKA